MASTIKLKFRVSFPAENEFKIVDKDLWEKSKNDFVAAANDEDGQQILANDYIELYGLSPIDNSYFEDDPNREVESIEQIIDETGKSI